MEHLSQSELEQRLIDILNNNLIITEDTKISLLPIKDENATWMIRWTHVLEEYRLRYGPYPSGFRNGFLKDSPIPRPDTTLASRASSAVSRETVPQDDYLVKYGKHEHIRRMFKDGIIRIFPASYYDDPSLNHAIKDKELEFTVQPHPSNITIKYLDGKTRQPKGVLRPLGDKITIKSQTDYYVYCLSCIFAPRLFIDFMADSCLIIKKPYDFVEKVLSAFKTIRGPLAGMAGPVFYVDPIFAKVEDANLFLWKHFRYSYQKEYRLIWVPDGPKNKLNYIDIAIGSLEDIATLIHIGET
jgi:hypothetical protein